MASVAPSKWTAEVPIDEPIRSSIPIWSIGRIVGSATDLDVEPGSVSFDDMVDWLRQRSIGAWRFIERERVSGRVSLLYRAFEFERIADANLFAATWSDALIQLRMTSLGKQIAHIVSPAGEHEIVSGREPHHRSRHRGAGRFDVVLSWLLDVLPVRLRARSLVRLRRRPEHRRLGALVTPIAH